MDVINYTMYNDNPYNRVIYQAIAPRYVPVKGSVEDAITALKASGQAILHVHWEEHVIRRCATSAEARLLADYVGERIAAFAALGGKVVWTVHNEAPHELEHLDAFMRLRRAIARSANLILVHNIEAIDVVSEQTGADCTKFFYLPHPCYLGVYEAEEISLAASPLVEEPNILFFGKVRRYKGIERLLETARALPLINFRIVGSALKGDPYGDEIAAAVQGLDNVTADFRHVENTEVAGFFRSATTVVLPYERFLTSGVALLSLGFGTPLIAPRVSQILEVAPGENQDLLFSPDKPGAMAQAIEHLLSLSPDEYQRRRQANLRRAAYFHPRRISHLLGSALDSLFNSAEQHLQQVGAAL